MTDQNSKLLEIGNKETLHLVLDLHKGICDIQLTLDIEYIRKVMDFYLWLKIWLSIFKKLSGRYSQKSARDVLKTNQTVQFKKQLK